MSATIPQLIINSPYEVPAEHWRYERETRTFHRVATRRPAGYMLKDGNGHWKNLVEGNGHRAADAQQGDVSAKG